MESFATPQENNEQSDAKNDVSRLQQQYRALVWQSRNLSEKDKKSALQFLEGDTKRFDPDTLKTLISHFNEAEKSVERLEQEYGSQIKDEITAGRFASGSEAKYLKWFRDLSYSEKAQYVKGKNSDLHNPKRKEVLDVFLGKRTLDNERIPEAVRAEHKDEFYRSDLQAREALVKGLIAEHKNLKADFLKLPPELQEKYRAQFKSCGLRDRAALLSALKTAKPGEQKETNEKNERQKLLDDFETQMADAVRDNLFSALSIPPNMAWAKTLSLEKLRSVVRGKKSDLFLRMNERIAVRDGFNGLKKELPENERGAWDLRFRNYDLDRRKPLLEELRRKLGKAAGTQEAQGNKYSETALRHTLQTTLQDSSLTQSRLLLTMLKRSRVLRRRAEISTDAKKTDVIAEKTAEKGGKVDKAQVIYLTELRQHGEARFGLKEYLKPKQQSDSRATNMTLLNERKEAVTAEQFQELVENHQKAELFAAWIALAQERLPGADTSKLRSVAEKIDPTVDLLKVAA
ncbi:hypothetical protein HYW83_04705 [Candidatus Peregrinibacteria bacterium]|nr:hypothetical protein [Candidatus Peregrinibacteria bacterium]